MTDPNAFTTDVSLAPGPAPASEQNSIPSSVRSVVLVHGAFVDGSGWEDVYRILKRNGFEVTIVQNPLQSLANDVAHTKRAIANATGEVILVGHSYGGVVVSEAGTDPKVAGLVYIAAFAPDTGESAETLTATPGGPRPPFLPPVNGLLFFDKTKFAEAFAADMPIEKTTFMADSLHPWGVEAMSGKVTNPAWRIKPSWYLVAADDQMIPPVSQRKMAARTGAQVEEAAGSHAIYMSQPEIVAAMIKKAAHEANKQ